VGRHYFPKIEKGSISSVGKLIVSDIKGQFNHMANKKPHILFRKRGFFINPHALPFGQGLKQII
jgi:hypothetical protein